MKLLVILLSGIFLFTSCNKSEEDEGVWIRIINNTSVGFELAKIGNTNYGTIGSQQTTEYLKVTDPVYAPYCQFILAGQPVFAGYGICGTPPLPPPIEDGYYTFRVDPAQGYFMVVMSRP
jgi:hypothetical protein